MSAIIEFFNDIKKKIDDYINEALNARLNQRFEDISNEITILQAKITRLERRIDDLENR